MTGTYVAESISTGDSKFFNIKVDLLSVFSIQRKGYMFHFCSNANTSHCWQLSDKIKRYAEKLKSLNKDCM